jgi:hypothetical protein
VLEGLWEEHALPLPLPVEAWEEEGKKDGVGEALGSGVALPPIGVKLGAAPVAVGAPRPLWRSVPQPP